MRLLAAMRRYGAPTLLWVDVAPNSEKVGTAEWSEHPGIMHGYLDRFAPLRFAAGASYGAWLKLITNGLSRP